MSEGVTVVARTRGGARILEVDLDTCDDVELLCRFMGRDADALWRLLRDPEWTVRMERDPECRTNTLEMIAKVGMTLARLTELITLPPEEARERGLNAQALREADNIIDLARRRGAVSA